MGDLAAPSSYSCVGGPFGSDLTAKDYRASGVPVIRGANLGGSTRWLRESGFVFVSPEKADQLQRNMAFPGDLIFTQRGTLGQVARVPLSVRYPAYLLSQSQMKLAPDLKRADPDFLYFFFTSAIALREIERCTIGTGVPHLNLAILKSLSVVLPTLTEQRKIAAILSSVDETIEKTEAVIAQLDVVKKAMLEELLTRGIPGRHSRFKQTEIGEVPEEWPLVPLGDAGRWLSGGTPSKATPEFWNGEIPWVSPKDMKVSRIADAIDHVSEAAIGSGTILAPARSILIVIRGMILVHSVPVALTTRPVAFNQDMKALVVNDAFVPEFLLYWLQSKAPAILQLVDVANHGTKRLPSPLLFALPLPQPSRHEQEQVCEVLAAVDRRIDSETKVLSSLASTKQNLSASLLSGETRVVGALTEAR